MRGTTNRSKPRLILLLISPHSSSLLLIPPHSSWFRPCDIMHIIMTYVNDDAPPWIFNDAPPLRCPAPPQKSSPIGLYITTYMNNQMEVLNLSFINFMQLNNVLNAFFVIYLPVINASMENRPWMSLRETSRFKLITCHSWAAFSCVLLPACLNSKSCISIQLQPLAARCWICS
jgi:hypothetical protein